MKKLIKPAIVILLTILFISNANAQSRDTIYVYVYADSVCIWNTDITSTCGAVFVNSVSIDSDSIAIIECDTSMEHFRCYCNFDTYTTLCGLAAGTYRAFIFRSEWSPQDTFFVGSVEFTVTQPSTLPFSIYSVSSGCNEITYVPYVEAGVPRKSSLVGNYPNPFNPITVISYTLKVSDHINVKIYDIDGREIETLVNEVKPAGNYDVKWDASRLSSGIYICKLRVGNEVHTHKMTLTK